ncbi:hypothetical protein SB11R_23095 [Pseudomonas oryzihabitans]|nr:hypothetical protein SB11R_23095 [Pseudomonas psychrotolerans]
MTDRIPVVIVDGQPAPLPTGDFIDIRAVPLVREVQEQGTSGTKAIESLIVDVIPPSASQQVVIGERSEINLLTDYDITQGGYVVAGEDVVNTAGNGIVDKLVGRMVQLNLTGKGVKGAVGVEPVVSLIGDQTIVAGLAMFYVPNMAAVANIDHIVQKAAFSNDDPRFMIHNRGIYLNGNLQELSPTEHIGLIEGHYYSAPARSMTHNVVAANVVYVTYVHVPHRATINHLGIEVVGASQGKARLALYNVDRGKVTTQVAQTDELDTSAAAVLEGSVSVEVDSGMYALVGVFSGTPDLIFHEVDNHRQCGASTPRGYAEYTYIPNIPFGPLPATANILPTFEANTIEPHIWFRI